MQATTQASGVLAIVLPVTWTLIERLSLPKLEQEELIGILSTIPLASQEGFVRALVIDAEFDDVMDDADDDDEA
ncbi:MAG TPA: hypothetical protein VKM55_02340 [Candidatus Lokiarchaeia archaeon]|nr:hypothetical protein [Candidatus Lokiarchaeia archaeon]